LHSKNQKYHAKSPMKSRIISIFSYLFSSIEKVLCTHPPGLAIANSLGFFGVNAAFARVGLSSVTPLKALLAGHSRAAAAHSADRRGRCIAFRAAGEARVGGFAAAEIPGSSTADVH
jgi:hypothetical protein